MATAIILFRLFAPIYQVRIVTRYLMANCRLLRAERRNAIVYPGRLLCTGTGRSRMSLSMDRPPILLGLLTRYSRLFSCGDSCM